jgi:outer membrane receptor protein involved in Fe transport
LFRTDLHDDLQFISSNGLATNAGYFRNVGQTRRQGLELDGSTRWGPSTWAVHYSWLDARYRRGFVENSPSNSTADANGAIVVAAGSRIPGLPRQMLKLRAEADMTPGFALAVDLALSSAIHARGDENNRDAGGRVPGYAVVNLDARWQVGKNLRWFGRVDNLFDRRYASFGILGSNVFTGPAGSFDAGTARKEQFRGYGAPRSFSLGLQATFGEP